MAWPRLAYSISDTAYLHDDILLEAGERELEPVVTELPSTPQTR